MHGLRIPKSVLIRGRSRVQHNRARERRKCQKSTVRLLAARVEGWQRHERVGFEHAFIIRRPIRWRSTGIYIDSVR